MWLIARFVTRHWALSDLPQDCLSITLWGLNISPERPIGGFRKKVLQAQCKFFGLKGSLLTLLKNSQSHHRCHHVCESFLFWWGVVGVVFRICDVRAVACINSVDTIKNHSQALLQFTGSIPHVMQRPVKLGTRCLSDSVALY